MKVSVKIWSVLYSQCIRRQTQETKWDEKKERIERQEHKLGELMLNNI